MAIGGSTSNILSLLSPARAVIIDSHCEMVL